MQIFVQKTNRPVNSQKKIVKTKNRNGKRMNPTHAHTAKLTHVRKCEAKQSKMMLGDFFCCFCFCFGFGGSIHRFILSGLAVLFLLSF